MFSGRILKINSLISLTLQRVEKRLGRIRFKKKESALHHLSTLQIHGTELGAYYNRYMQNDGFCLTTL